MGRGILVHWTGDNATHTEESYIVAHKKGETWYIYCTVFNIDEAKEKAEEVRKLHPGMKVGIFEEIRHTIINKIDEEFI